MNLINSKLILLVFNNICLHINSIFKENELESKSVVKDYLTTAADGKQYKTKYYNLDVVISVGYRVKSKRGTEFRIWANKLLKEFLVKGFVLNEKRLKEQSQMQLMELQRTVKLIQVDKTTANHTFFIALILNKLIAMNKPKILPLPSDKSASYQKSNLKHT
jgi:hypothetical protein